MFKIALFVDRLTVGGVERVTQVLSKILADYGHEVTVVTGPLQKDEYQLSDNVKRINLNDFLVDSQNLSLYEQFDVVVLQQYWLKNQLSLYKALQKTNTRTIGIDHNVFIAYKPQGHPVPLDRYENYHWADALVTLSPFDQFLWKQTGAKALFVPNPTTFENYFVGERASKNVVIVGRFWDQQKQPQLAVQAMDELHKLNGEAVLQMIGPPGNIEQYTRNKPYIQVLGFRSNVKEYMQNASVMMLSSAFEGYPMVVVEAISQGIPVVAFELKYLAIMQCGVIQVPKRDTKKMAEEINKLLTDESYRQEKARYAQQCLDQMNGEVLPRWNDLLYKVVNEEEIDYPDEVTQEWVERVLLEEGMKR